MRKSIFHETTPVWHVAIYLTAMPVCVLLLYKSAVRGEWMDLALSLFLYLLMLFALIFSKKKMFHRES